MAVRSGFLSTLEAVIASTIFLLFIINAAPMFTGETGQIDDMSLLSIHSAMNSLDRSGQLRANLTDRDLEALETTLEPYAAPLNLAVGVLYSNATTYNYSGSEEVTYTFENSIGQEERTILRFHIDDASNLEVRLNGDVILTTSSGGYDEMTVTSDTISGANTITVNADSADLDIVLDQYRYEQSGDLPTDTAIASTGYHVAGYNETIEPSELRVFMWQ
jgi:hypothetical protein